MSIPQQKEKSSVGTRKKGSSSPPLTNICLYRTGYMFRKIAFFSVSAFSGFERCSVIPALRLRSTSSENAFAVIAMIGTTASNDSFNFSDNFVRYKFNKYSCLSVLIILQFSDYSIYSLYYHRIPILSIFLLLRSC